MTLWIAHYQLLNRLGLLTSKTRGRKTRVLEISKVRIQQAWIQRTRQRRLLLGTSHVKDLYSRPQIFHMFCIKVHRYRKGPIGWSELHWKEGRRNNKRNDDITKQNEQKQWDLLMSTTYLLFWFGADRWTYNFKFSSQ